MHPNVQDHPVWTAVGVSLLAVASAILVAAMLIIALRSSNDILGRLVPGWPWW